MPSRLTHEKLASYFSNLRRAKDASVVSAIFPIDDYLTVNFPYVSEQGFDTANNVMNTLGF